MSAGNTQEGKAERRTEREAAARQQGFMAAVQFALHAAGATSAVPVEVLEDSLAYGEKLVQPGISLDDALEMEQGLRALRSLLTYRRGLEGVAPVYTVLTAEPGEDGVTLTLKGVERADLEPGERVVITPMGKPDASG